MTLPPTCFWIEARRLRVQGNDEASRTALRDTYFTFFRWDGRLRSIFFSLTISTATLLDVDHHRAQATTGVCVGGSWPVSSSNAS